MNRQDLSKFSRSFPYLLLLLALVFNFAIRWHLRDMPLERDEGEYAYAGQLILQGVPPYELAYNMKFPGVYFAYAALMATFGQSAAGIHIGIILTTSITGILIFFIGRELLGNLGGLLASAIFVCLSALPKAAGLAGHATHFVSLFVCAGLLALLIARKKNSTTGWLVSGTAFGVAILMKQHALFFPAFILLGYLWKEFRRDNRRKTVLIILVFCGGCILPFLITAIGFACAGLWGKFIFWTFQYARQYVSILPLRAAPGQFVAGFAPVFTSGMLVWLCGLIALPLVFLKKERSNPVELIGLIFLAGMAAACPGLYFRNHYFLMAVPGLALLNAFFILSVARSLKNSGCHGRSKWLPTGLVVFLLGNLLFNNFRIWFMETPLQASRELYGTSPYPESGAIAKYLNSNTSPDDKIAVLGSEPEIFFLSQRRSASGYIYLYSLTEPQPLAPQMQKEFIGEIEAARPKYVVFVNIFTSWYSIVLPGEASQSLNSIPAWWDNYSTNYLLTGAVKISADQPSQFLWDEKLLNYSDTTNDDLLIYRRK
jgi:4-amino-4-deoxy-L-arabinose transferase-like glycosyltransferase